MKSNLKKFEKSCKRALSIEAVPNIKMVTISNTGEKDFLVTYYFFQEPSEDDKEAISLIETEIFADAWGWVGNVEENIEIVDTLPKIIDSQKIMIAYLQE